MSQYSEMIGSFIRTGNYPLEANYIFLNESDLKAFFNDPINNTLLHEGLLKIVLNDENGEQALYWVSNKNDKLLFSKLISFNSIEDLKEGIELLTKDLNLEILDRKSGDDVIWGTTDPTTIDKDLNSILKLSKAILLLREDLQNEIERSTDFDNLLKSELQATVGTTKDDIRKYLNTLDYLNLTKVSETLHYFLDSVDTTKDTIDTFPELQAFLNGFGDSDTLLQILTDLWHNILGAPLPNTPFRTLRGLLDFYEELKSYSINRMDNIQSEIDLTLIGVGLSGDGAYNPDKETYYLKNATSVMNALKILDSLINEAINNCHYESEDTESVKIDIKKEPTKTTIKAWVKTSSENGNDIVIKNDGIYHNVDSEYEDGILTIKVNGNIRLQHVIGLSSIVDTAYYDTTLEAIIIVFKLLNGDKQTVTIPAKALIAEWEVDNSHATKVVELTRQRVVAGGGDKLSADVRISANKYNILEKDGNTLLVKGLADNIVYNGDVTVKSKLDSLTQHDVDNDSDIADLNQRLSNEINRAKESERDILLALDNEIKRSTDKDNLLTNDLNAEITRATNSELKLTTDLTNEIKRSTDKDTQLEKALNSEINRATLAELDLNHKLTDEITRATDKESALDHRIDDLQDYLDNNFADDATLKKRVDTLETNLTSEINRAKLSETELTNKINQETERASNKESALDHRIDDVEASLNNEIKRSTDFDNNLQNELDSEIARSVAKDNELSKSLSDEITRATGKENTIAKDLSDEVVRAKDAEKKLNDSINDEINRSVAKDDSLQSSLTNEINRAKLAELELTNNLNNEISRATTSESNLDAKINTEVNRAKAAENTLTTNLNSEITRSTNKDNLLLTDLTAEVNRAKLAEQGLTNDLTNEIKRASDSEKSLKDKIDDLQTLLNTNSTNDSKLLDKVTDLEKNLDTEILRALAKETLLQTNIDTANTNINSLKTKTDTTNTNLTNEINRSKLAEQELKDLISDEELRATGVESNLDTKITNLTTRVTSEETRAKAEEAKLATSISTTNTNLSNLSNKNSNLETKVDSEIVRSVNKDNALADEISDLINKCIVSGTITATAAAAELAKLGTGFSSVKEIGLTLKSFMIDTDTANSTINKWKELESFLTGITDLLTLSGLLLDLSNTLTAKIDTETARAKDAEKGIATNKSSIDALTQTVSGIEKRCEDKINSAKDTLEKSIANVQTNLTSELNLRLADDNKLSSRIDALTSSLVTVADTVNSHTDSINDINQDLVVINDNLEDVIAPTLTSLLKLINDEITRSTNKDTELQTSINNINSKLTTVETKVNTNVSDISNLKSKTDVTNTNVTNLSNKVTSIETKVDKNVDDIKSANTKVTLLETKVTSMESNIKDIKDDIKDVESDITSLDTKISANTTNITNLIKDVANIETALGNSEVKIDTTANTNIVLTISDNGLIASFEWGPDYD